MNRRWIAPCILAAFASWACGPAELPGDPNLLLVTLDTTRADRLGVMGDETARTPVLDSLAASGVLFEQAYASVSLTLPSHTTILSGVDPNLHGVHDNNRFLVPESLETLPERLAARGYDTAAFVAAAVLDSSFGLDRGFHLYDDGVTLSRNPLQLAVPSRRGAVVTDLALAWLDRERSRPFFLWVHYYDVHTPRRPPPPFEEIGDPYAGELAYVDAQLGRLLEGVRRAAAERETLTVVVGDHGESLGQHGEFTHGLLAYDSTLHVPLIAAGPGFPAGIRSSSLARTIDVAPTILAAVGEPALAASSGIPLQERLAGDDAQEVVGYFESHGPSFGLGWQPIEGIRTSRFKYTAEPKPVELYEVREDPGELRNRADELPETVARMERLHGALTGGETPAAPSAELSPELAEQLAALGYVSQPQHFEADERPDPRRVVGAFTLVEQARGLAIAGRVSDAVMALEILRESRTVGSLAARHLAALYQELGRFDEAISLRRTLFEESGTDEARSGLIGALFAAGRLDEALGLLEQMAGEKPVARLSSRVMRARILFRLGRFEEAADAARALLEEEPHHDAALALASRIRAVQTGPAPEIPRLRQALAEAPQAERLVETRLLLAGLLLSENRRSEAAEALEAAERPPLQHRALLAEILLEDGDLDRAAALHESVLAERPTAQASRFALAKIYRRLGRLDEALAQSEMLISIDASDPAFFVERGLVHHRSHRLAEAEADYRRALSIDTTLPETYLNLALVELATERDPEAEDHLLRAVELRPDYAKAHFHLARIYAGRGDPRAGEHSERAIRAGAQERSPVPRRETR